jgi:integrase
MPQLPITYINEDFLLKFKEFLELSLTGETPHNYFKLLSRVLHYATKEKLFEINPATDIRIKRKEGTLKNVLSIEEIRTLANTNCSNPAVKNAFLFCCFTGLRYCDVSRLQWQHILNDKLTITQAKTSFKVEVDLHDSAKKFMGLAGQSHELIFNLPTTLNGCNKVLKLWVQKAGISKKITWHCGRHTLACNLVKQGVDVLVVSKILGQTSCKHTYKYIKQADLKLRDALQKLPVI